MVAVELGKGLLVTLSQTHVVKAGVVVVSVVPSQDLIT
jgi:hypothetical protein